jgi:hypothetical protein
MESYCSLCTLYTIHRLFFGTRLIINKINKVQWVDFKLENVLVSLHSLKTMGLGPFTTVIVVAHLTSNSFEGHPCCMHADYFPSLCFWYRIRLGTMLTENTVTDSRMRVWRHKNTAYTPKKHPANCPLRWRLSIGLGVYLSWLQAGFSHLRVHGWPRNRSHGFALEVGGYCSWTMRSAVVIHVHRPCS